MRLIDFAEVRDRIADMEENVSIRWRRWQSPSATGTLGIAFLQPRRARTRLPLHSVRRGHRMTNDRHLS